MTILIPEQLKRVVENQLQVETKGDSVQEALNHLIENYPYVKDRLFKSEGVLNRFVNVYINDEDIRFLDGLSTKVTDKDVISILPSIAGG
jgi:molybdopterin synthase sulfur carrier subunit